MESHALGILYFRNRLVYLRYGCPEAVWDARLSYGGEVSFSMLLVMSDTSDHR